MIGIPRKFQSLTFHGGVTIGVISQGQAGDDGRARHRPATESKGTPERDSGPGRNRKVSLDRIGRDGAAGGMAGTRLRYQDLIAPNGRDSGARVV